MDGREEAIGHETEQLDRLFLAFLEAEEAGRDAENELVERAGPLAAGLAERIRVHRELTALSRDLGLRRKPTRIGRFEVVRLVGAGGISRVYEAHDPRLGRTVALKVLDRKGMLDRSDRAWVLNEGRSLARITHRNVARIFDVGEIDEDPYIAMELLPGPSLADVIQLLREGREGGVGAAGARPDDDRARALAARYASWSARIGLLESLAGALAHCHDHGILHRDVKPANVLFDADGEPRLIDFGLAHVEGADEDSRLGLTQALVGTAAYIAPEQVTSDATGADPRSDQFSLGTLGYELFALENPFHRPSRHATLAAVEAADPPPLATRARAVPPDLARVIHHTLAKAPQARYPDLAALAADLRAVREHRPISVAEPSLGHVARLWLRRHRRGATVAGTIALAAVCTWTIAWTAETLGTRDEVLGELTAIRPEAYSDPGELEQAFEPLMDLQGRARSFEAAGALRRRLGISAEVERIVHAWSRRLAAMIAADEERSERTGLAMQDMIYRRLVWQDQQLCPDCPYNVEYRKRGHVGFPPEVLEGARELTWLGPARFDSATTAAAGPRGDPDSLSLFQPTPFLELLVPGTYRLHAWRPGAAELTYEAVFHVEEGWPPFQPLRVQRPHAGLLERSVLVERGGYELRSGIGTLLVPAYRILSDLVSVADFEAYCSETDQRATEFRPSSDDPSAPASVSYDSAMRYAAWAGGRLPHRIELELAHEAARIVLPEPSERDGVGEYVLDPVQAWDNRPGFLVYGTIGTGLVADRTRVTPTRTPANSGSGQISFRVAFSADDPELYRELARSPLEK